MNIIETKALTKTYGKNRGIKDLDLKIEEGEIYGFIGPNGAGKSTTIRVLLNFIYATSGEAKIFNLDCAKESHKIKELVGYVPSEVNYYKHMTVKEILEYAASFKKEKSMDRAKELCKIFDVDTSKKVGELSLGNRKKVAIIQALINSPRLLILDEPTNGLDPLIQKRLFEVLKEENQKGMTIFFSSHNLGEVQRFCHRVGIIKEGQLIEVKTIENLMGKHMVKVTIASDEDLKLVLNQKGISNVNSEDKKTSFLFNGDINELIKSLANIKLNTLKIEEPSLEESFMTYYDGKEN